MTEQAVIVRFAYGQTDLDLLFELEDQLEATVVAAGVGELDGNEISADGADGTLYLYGPDADKLLEAVALVLASATCIHNVVATVRYGPPEDGVEEKVVSIGSLGSAH